MYNKSAKLVKILFIRVNFNKYVSAVRFQILVDFNY